MTPATLPFTLGTPPKDGANTESTAIAGAEFLVISDKGELSIVSWLSETELGAIAEGAFVRDDDSNSYVIVRSVAWLYLK